MPTFPAPVVPFIPARHHGGNQTPKAVVIHATVSPDTPGTARTIANWWKGPTSPVTSASYIVDPREVIQCVGDHTVAYHCGYNTNTIGIELCDEQTGPPNRWKDSNSQAIIARAAKLTAQLCLAYGIEPRRPSVSELKAKGPHGIYGHNDSRLAFGYTDHSDPRDFDWPAFIALVRKEITAIRTAASTPAKPPVKPTPPKPPTAPTTLVNVMHAPLEFNASDEGHTHDIEAIFARAAAKDVKWITGTEAGPGSGNTNAELKRCARKYGYKVFVPGSKPGRGADKGGTTDAWIAVKKDFITGGWKTGFIPVIPGSYSLYKAQGKANAAKLWPKWGTKGVVWVEFDSPLGHIGVSAGHYLTKGRKPGPQSIVLGVDHWAWNKKMAKAIGDWAREVGKGDALAFYGGDQNMRDEWDKQPQGDTFLGNPLTSVSDELGHRAPTRAGSQIDVIASYNHDGRVKAAYWRTLSDSRFPLSVDHNLCEAGFNIAAK